MGCDEATYGMAVGQMPRKIKTKMTSKGKQKKSTPDI
jgi:hypothetical protein